MKIEVIRGQSPPPPITEVILRMSVGQAMDLIKGLRLAGWRFSAEEIERAINS